MVYNTNVHLSNRVFFITQYETRHLFCCLALNAMDKLCDELVFDDNWLTSIANELQLSRDVLYSSTSLLSIKFKNIESISIHSIEGAYLLCAILLCHKFLEDAEQEQLRNLVFIKKRFFSMLDGYWAQMEMNLLEVVDFNMLKLININRV